MWKLFGYWSVSGPGYWSILRKHKFITDLFISTKQSRIFFPGQHNGQVTLPLHITTQKCTRLRSARAARLIHMTGAACTVAPSLLFSFLSTLPSVSLLYMSYFPAVRFQESARGISHKTKQKQTKHNNNNNTHTHRPPPGSTIRQFSCTKSGMIE